MTVRDVIFTLCKHMKIIVLFPVIFVTIYSFWNYTTQAPTYSTQAVLYTIDKGSTNINEIATVERLMVNYRLLAQTSEVRSLVERAMGGSIAGTGVSISMDTTNHTMTVSTTDANPARAANVANAYAATIISYLDDTMGLTNVSFLEPASVPYSPTGPLREKPIMTVGMLSVAVGIIFVLILEYSNTTIRTPEDISKNYNLTVLAEIGKFSKAKKK